MREIEFERELKVFANRRRLAILNFLRKRNEASVGEVASVIRLSFTSTSKHLTMLERAGFLEKEQRSVEVFYRISSTPPQTYKALSHIF